MPLWLWFLCGLAGLLLLYRWRLYRADQRTWHAAQWDCEDGEALRLLALQREQDERRAARGAPLPWWGWPMLVGFNGLAVWMLVDLWGTPRVWMALIQLGWPIGTLLVAWRLLHATATAPGSQTAPVVDVQARRSLTPAAPRH